MALMAEDSQSRVSSRVAEVLSWSMPYLFVLILFFVEGLETKVLRISLLPAMRFRCLTGIAKKRPKAG